ncbi:MAG: diguanylate cyclase [Isosphaeraceae bacterium]|nr:diguanylate cyclase [Isosphaeraceae bacterium]
MPKVLIVDDVPDNVKLLSYELSEIGFEIVTASDGPNALERARLDSPDIILLDIMMPGLDGIEVCRRLKADPELKRIPIIIVSACGMEKDVIRGFDAGAQDYVTKPFALPIVLARVRSAARIKADSDRIADMNERLAELAMTDGLTGLKNHRYFRETFPLLLSLTNRQNLHMSVLMIDTDDFKTYNDSFGHPAGDEVLKALALILARQVRQQDVVARYGGEEFAVLLPGIDGAAARATAERLRAAVEANPWPLRPITISIGLASQGPNALEGQALVDRADCALYEAKRAGRNCLVCYGDTWRVSGEPSDRRQPRRPARLCEPVVASQPGRIRPTPGHR